ncbi:MAG: zinc ribbon domain-containing protein [Turicibacter sp.]
MIIVSLLVGIVFFVIALFGLGQVVWIYLDAKERGDRLKGVWTLFAVVALLLSIGLPFLLPLPLLVYLLISRSSGYKCPNCSHQVKNDYCACPQCGTTLKSKCPTCHQPVDSKWSYCPSCSAKLEKEQE